MYIDSGKRFIGSMNVNSKIMSDQVEDTIEIFALVMKQIISVRRRDRLDSSGTSYSLHINSPNSGDLDLFRFNTTKEPKKYVSGAFYDRICFTQSIVK